jgi:hypothetical protein
LIFLDDYGNQEKAVGKNGKNSGADDSKRENNAILPENSVVELENHMTENESLETQSQFFSYFVFFTILCLVAYLVVHNKKKVKEKSVLIELVGLCCCSKTN